MRWPCDLVVFSGRVAQAQQNLLKAETHLNRMRDFFEDSLNVRISKLHEAVEPSVLLHLITAEAGPGAEGRGAMRKPGHANRQRRTWHLSTFEAFRCYSHNLERLSSCRLVTVCKTKDDLSFNHCLQRNTKPPTPSRW